MITKKDLQNMPVKELIKCEGCGGFHSMEESEIVIIRMIKGKDCSISPASHTRRNIVVVENDVNTDVGLRNSGTPNVVTAPEKVFVDEKAKLPDGTQMDADGVGYRIPPAEMEKINKNRKSIIPPGLAGMMIGPDDPNFETKGAKEIRKH